LFPLAALNGVINATQKSFNCTNMSAKFFDLSNVFCVSAARPLSLMAGAFVSLFALLFVGALCALFTMNRLLKPRFEGYSEIIGDDDLVRTDVEQRKHKMPQPSSVLKKLGCRLYYSFLLSFPLRCPFSHLHL